MAKTARNDSVLLAAAKQVFAEKGFEAATIAEIAARAELAVGTLYLRYPSKGALLAAILVGFEITLVAAMSEPHIHLLPWPKRFEAIFEALFREAERHVELPALTALSMRTSGGALGHPYERGAIIRQWITKTIRQGQREGALRDLNAEYAAAIAFGMVDGAMEVHFRAGPTAVDSAAEMLGDAARRWLLMDVPTG